MSEKYISTDGVNGGILQKGLGPLTEGVSLEFLNAFSSKKPRTALEEIAQRMFAAGDRDGVPYGGQTGAVVDELLENLSYGLFPKKFLCEKIYTPVPSERETGKFGGHESRHLTRTDVKHDGGAEIKYVTPNQREVDLYSIEPAALRTFVSPSDMMNVNRPFNDELEKTAFLRYLILLAKELELKDHIDNLTGAGSVTLSTSTDQFDDYSNSNPLESFATAVSTIAENARAMAKIAWMDIAVAAILRNHPQVFDGLRITKSVGQSLSDQELAKALGVDTLYITDASWYDPSDSSEKAVWGKNIYFSIYEPGPGLFQRIAGYYFFLSKMKEIRIVKRQGMTNPLGRDIFGYSGWQFKSVLPEGIYIS